MAFDPVKFGRWLARFRAAEKLSQRDVHKRSGGWIKHASSISNVETGLIAHPQIRTFVGLANGLGVHTMYLLEKAGYLDDDEKKPRVSAFNRFEREALAHALGAYLARHPHADHAGQLVKLLDELNDVEAERAAFDQRTNQLAAR